MNYQVTARKWRPQSFDEVVGQEIVTRTLQNAIKSERVAHAFLFSGVRGVGKTTTARILAKSLNCLEGLTGSPCSRCDSCQEIAAANSVDVLEIDAASNTGVDNIRDLRESVRYGTARDRFKIFIIDEAHMLSNQAFNALLKTLEEPPPHVKFILATTELEKIPATIISRCQQFTFKPISFSLIFECLKEIVQQEGIEITDYGLRSIVSLAQGSMRDAQSVLDQIISFAGKKISDEDVRVLLGVVDEQVLNGVVEAIVQRGRKEIIDLVEQLKSSGVDPQIFCSKLARRFRDIMVYKVMGWKDNLLDLPDSAKDNLDKQANEFSSLDLIRFYDLMVSCEGELRYHSHPYVHLEMTLVKLIELSQLPLLEEVVARLDSGGHADSDEVSHKLQVDRQVLLNTSSLEVTAGSEEKQTEGISSISSNQKLKSSVPKELVSDFLSALNQKSPRLCHSIQQASEIKLSEDKLSVFFESKESFHRDLLLEEKNQEELAMISARITSSTPKIEVELLTFVGEEVKEYDPAEDSKVKAFVKTFPGRVIVEKKTVE